MSRPVSQCYGTLRLVIAAYALTAFAGVPDPVADNQLRYDLTVARMKAIAQACLDYQTATNHFPEGESVDELRRLLAPDFIPKEAEWIDGWGRPFRYRAINSVETRTGGTWMSYDCRNRPESGECQVKPVTVTEVLNHTRMTLASAGEDGLWETDDPDTYTKSWNRSTNDDLVVRDGEWLKRMLPGPLSGREAMIETRRTLHILALSMSQYVGDGLPLPAAESLTELYAGLGSGTLPPNYAPVDDAWGTPLRFLHWITPGKTPDSKPVNHYRIASAGSDGKFEQDDLRRYRPREFSDDREDLVIEDSFFVSDYVAKDASTSALSLRTMGKIKTVASALEQWAVDHHDQYPDSQDIASLVGLLAPYPIAYFHRDLMVSDSWGQRVRYDAWSDLRWRSQESDHYCLASPGPDGKYEFGEFRRYLAPQIQSSASPSDDIVVCDGQFVRQPTE